MPDKEPIGEVRERSDRVGFELVEHRVETLTGRHGFDHVQIARSTLAPGHLAILWWVANWCRMLNANEAARVGEPARNTGTP